MVSSTCPKRIFRIYNEGFPEGFSYRAGRSTRGTFASTYKLGVREADITVFPDEAWTEPFPMLAIRRPVVGQQAQDHPLRQSFILFAPRMRGLSVATRLRSSSGQVRIIRSLLAFPRPNYVVLNNGVSFATLGGNR